MERLVWWIRGNRFVARNPYHAKKMGNVRILDLGCGIVVNDWFHAKECFNA